MKLDPQERLAELQQELADKGTMTLKVTQRNPELPPRADILREAETLITGDRNKSYGSPTQNFQNTADLWNVQFGHMLKDGQAFTATHVAQAMAQLKLARMIASPKRDNWADLVGYAACGYECDVAQGNAA